MTPHSHRGFTLIELLIVITLTGILMLLATNVDFNRKTSVEKSGRIVAKVQSMIQSTKMQVSSGRGVVSGGVLINPTSTELSISTESISIKYYSGGTLIGSGESISYPFYGDKGYTVQSVYQYTDKSLTITGALTAPVRIVFDSDRNITFSGADVGIANALAIGMTLGYEKQLHTIELDRRSWRLLSK